MTKGKKARALGFNHVALEVGDIEEALAFYGQFLEFGLRSKSETAAFIDLGDQFINFSKGRRQAPDDDRHVGLVVDDKEAVRQTLEVLGIEILPRPLPRFSRSLGQSDRNCRLPKHSVHQGAPCAARYGDRAARKESLRARGTGRQRHVAGLACLCTLYREIVPCLSRRCHEARF